MQITTDMSERGFQKLIVKDLLEKQGYRESLSTDFDREFCVNENQLFEFIKTTQKDAYALIQRKGERKFLVRLDKKIQQKGIVETLRKGVTFFDKIIDLFYSQPVSMFNQKDAFRYQANIFSVTQELVYSDAVQNRVDLVIFLNGLPIITMELKNAYTYQAVQNAIKQYQKTRDPKDKLFSFARCLVHFAVDTDEAYMTTHLKKNNTIFFPFNKGLNDGKPYPPYGKSNPVNPDGLKTQYLWAEVLTKNSLSNIIEKFAQFAPGKDEKGKRVKSKDNLIFPRYHQLTVVRNLLAYAKEHGIGQKYLIQHSAGSGKSFSITWLAHQLTGLTDKMNLHAVFDSVVVVTDRKVLDKQIRDNIKAFAQVKNVVEAITGKGDSKTGQLTSALANQKKIIIVTIQTFPFVLAEMDGLAGANFAIIIDEAHSSQSGETSRKMNVVLAKKKAMDEYESELTFEDKINALMESRKMLPNASYFAFTATPKNKTLELFGEEKENGKFYPFHLYSMKQAIEEGFILDVLQNYTTYRSYYKLIKAVEENPAYDVRKAQRKLKNYVELHEQAIGEKAKIMVDHFIREVSRQINGKAKAMVVTKNILAAIKYKYAFDDYLQEMQSPYKAIVAFSGAKEYNGVSHTEVEMNKFPDGNNDIPQQFQKDEYRFLIVAEKFQTGFDQLLLHTMYVDKRLAGVQAVQTLSRLNRAYKPYKKDTFVLDFVNHVIELKEAFEPYYTTTILSEETDPNKLNDLQEELDEYQVYSEEELTRFLTLYLNQAERTQIDPIIDGAAAVFKNQLSEDEQVDFKVKAKSFVRTYSYLSKILEFQKPYWEKLWWFLKFLIPKLHIRDDDQIDDILEKVDMDSYRISRQGTEDITLVESKEVYPIPVTTRGGKDEILFDTLANIIEFFNKRFGDIEWSEPDKAYQILAEQIPADMKSDSDTIDAIEKSDKQNAKITSDKKLNDLMQKLIYLHTEIYKKYQQNENDFQNRYQEFIFDLLWQQKEE